MLAIFTFAPPQFAEAVTAASSAATNPVVGIFEKFHVDWTSFGAAVVNFALVAVVLYYFALRPVLKTMDARNQKIADGLRYADEMKARLDAAEKSCAERLEAAAREAVEISRAAVARATAREEQVLKTASEKAEEILTRAREEISNERGRMLETLRGEVATLVVQTTAKVLARNLTDDEQQRFAARAADEIANTK